MHEIKVSEIIDKDSDQSICFEPGTAAVIQMPMEYINKVIKMTSPSTSIFKLENTGSVYDRLTVKDHLKFYKKWYGSNLDISDLLKQFALDTYQGTRLSQCDAEIIQRMGYIHALLADHRYILAVNPLHNATVENIRLFHKVKKQIKNAGRGLVVITSSTEDAFVLTPDISKLNAQGIKSVETEEEQGESESTFNRIKAKSKDKTIFIDLEDIEYIESSEGRVYINISREKFIIDATLADTEKRLRKHGFYRCHRSYIVNLGKVKEIITWSKNTYSIVIENEDRTKIPLSRTKYGEIQELLIM